MNLRRILASLVAGLLTPSLLHAQAPLYDLRGNTSGDWFAASIAGVGDVDGDGFGDVALGAPEGAGLQPQAGYVMIRSGRTAGHIRTVLGEQTGDRFGWSVAGLGDVDGDGLGDLIVGAPRHDAPGLSDAGAVYVYSGATGALLSKRTGDDPDDICGWAVAGPGDVDLDGVPDYAYSMPWSNAAHSGAGMVWVRSGANHSILRFYGGDAPGDLFGFSLDSAGDLDGDGRADLVAGAPYADAASGGPDVGRGYALSTAADDLVLWSFLGPEAHALLGTSIASGVDVNGDGVTDMALGAPYADFAGEDAGRAFVVSGSGSHPVVAQVDGEAAHDHFGLALDLIEDLDDDGRGELIVGAPGWDSPPLWHIGRVSVRSGGYGPELMAMTGYQANDNMGQAVACVGDLNADGWDDVCGGARRADGGTLVDNGWGRLVLGHAPAPSGYCASKTNSLGCTPFISYAGCPSYSISDYFVLVAVNVIPNEMGILIWSQAPASTPFHGGTLCVAPPIVRTPPQVAQSTGSGTCPGQYLFLFDHAYMTSHALVPGDTVYAQYWSRDTGLPAPDNIGLTNGLEFTILP